MNEATVLCTLRPCPGCGIGLMVRLDSPAPFCPRCAADVQPLTRGRAAVRLERQSRRKRATAVGLVLIPYWTFVMVELGWLHATVGACFVLGWVTMKERRLRRVARGL